MVTLNSVDALSDRVKTMTGNDGAPRISGLRVRPPVVEQAAYDLSTARGEPSEFRRGGLVISRPVTADMAERQHADRQGDRASGYVEQDRATIDRPSWLAELSASEQEIMQRRAVEEWQRENGV